jgi:capsular polysaccharide export protein
MDKRPAQPGGLARTALVRDPALRTLEHLFAFFPDIGSLRRAPAPGLTVDAILSAAWTADTERDVRLARRLGATLLTVRGGFLRSIGSAHGGAAPISLSIDAEGQTLEDVLAAADRWPPEVLDQARALIGAFRSAGLSRTQGAVSPDAVLGPPDGRPVVLVVDRHGDEPCAPDPEATPAHYRHMLEAARADHPTARIVVKRDPSDPAAGLLSAGALALADTVLDADVDVALLLKGVDAVYAVDSGLGFEALLHDRPVTLFGSPFYGGRGLTDDRCAAVPGRTGLSLEALFAGAVLLHPRYVDPLTGRICDAAVAIERLAAFKRHAERTAGQWIGLNIPIAKQAVMQAFLSGPFSSFRRTGGLRPTEAPADVRYAAWASWESPRVARARAAAPDRITNIEDGFIRSVGLGSSFHPASSLVVDRRGIYYDPTRPSDLEHILATTEFGPALLEAARTLRDEVVALGLSKYNLAAAPMPHLGGPGACRILVPGQVEDDASVRAGGGGMTNLGLLERVRAENPDAFIAYKEHPDVTAGNRRGRIPPTRARELADVMLTGQDVIACIAAVDEVHTLTSLTGFEALLRGKPVTTYGWPFYAGWGLTDDRGGDPAPARRRISLDALVAGALILYPLYLDPESWLPCDALTFVRRLRDLRAHRLGQGDMRPPAGRLRRLATAIRYMATPPRPPRY